MGTTRGETLVDLSRWRAEEHSDRTLYHFLDDGSEGGATLTFGALHRRSGAIAQALREFVEVGERVLIVLPPGPDFVSAFFGCQYAGVVAIPTLAPHPARPDRGLPRIRAILRDARPAAILTSEGLRAAIGPPLLEDPGSPPDRLLAVDQIDETRASDWRPPAITAESLALLQYTSGSTGEPRGVMITHGNLLHNLGIIREAFGADERSVGVFWLPFHHDMGLIGGVLEPLFCGGQSTFLSPVEFIQRPIRWLQLITELGATISGGPNFAYDECVRRIAPEQREALDLHSWEVAFCGAEPVHAETLNRFAEAFAPAGFRREAYFPCYGLAEATLMVTGGEKQEPPVVAPKPGSDTPGTAAEFPSELRSAPARMLVGCGSVRGGQRVVVVDPETCHPLGEGEVGEIWVAGASVGQGYWGRPEPSAQVFNARMADGQGPFLRTGDLGFLQGRELFVTGRLKDLIIISGRNHYPHDIERTAQGSHPAIRDNGCAAFAVETEQQEHLILVAEVDPHVARRRAREDGPRDSSAIVQAIRRAVSEEHGLTPQRVVLVRAMAIPRTSSGKIRRLACREHFLARDLQTVEA